MADRRGHDELAQRFFALANEACQNDDPHSPDYFYQAAVHSWPCLIDPQPACPPAAAWQIYHASVAGLIAEGERFGRFQTSGQMIIYQPGGPIALSLACLGLPWTAAEIGQTIVAQPPVKSRLTQYHAHPGFGVPVVVVRKTGNCPRQCERFLPPSLPFAATVVLRPAGDGPAAGAILEFYDPLRVNTIEVCGTKLVMAGDISAPLEYRLEKRDRSNILGFLEPFLSEPGDGLRFLEPYQPGKIPIIFIHGLLSDPTTWFDVANDLRAQPWFNDQFQIWGFSYATGKPFITSARQLREQSTEALALLDPNSQDPALRQMVLIGHSMGGLVAKLQVTYSDDQIWHSFAKIPLDSIAADSQVKSELELRCFFDPQPFVRRVVFIATPHGGSSLAARGIGRVSSALVEPAPEAEAMHALLVANNPGVFSRQFERRVPTSIEMLEPSDPTLQAIRQLRLAPCLTLHSIIGTAHPSLADGPGDGVVPVSSAQHPCVVSERLVDATHTSILRDPATQAEIRRILREHLSQCVCQPGWPQAVGR